MQRIGRTVLLVVFLAVLCGCGPEDGAGGPRTTRLGDAPIHDPTVMQWLERATADMEGLADDEDLPRLRMICAVNWAFAGHDDRVAKLMESAGTDEQFKLRFHTGMQWLRQGRFDEGRREAEDFDDAAREQFVRTATTFVVQDGRVERALEMARQFDEEGARSIALKAAARAGRLDDARGLLEGITDPKRKRSARMAIAMMEMVETPKADWPARDEQEMRSRIHDPWNYAVSYARAGHPELARRAAGTVTNSCVWAALAKEFHRQGDRKSAAEALDRAVGNLDSPRREAGVAKTHAAGSIAEAAAAAGNTDLAVKMVKECDAWYTNAIWVWVLLGRTGEAAKILAGKTEPMPRTYAEMNITKALVQSGRLDELDELIRSKDPKQRIRMYGHAIESRIRQIRRDGLHKVSTPYNP